MLSKIEQKELLKIAVEQGTITPAIVDYLGTSVDVFAKNPIAGLGLKVFDFSKAGVKPVSIDGVEIDIPEIVDLLPNSKINQTAGSKTSMDVVSNELAASMGVKGDAGLFSAGVKASFRTSNKSAAYAFYSYVYESISYAEMKLNSIDSKYFTDDFASDLNALPESFSQDNYPQFATFFEKWGLYYLFHSGLGGELDTTNAVATSDSTTTATAQVDLSAQYKGLYYAGSFDASVTASASWSVFSSESVTQAYIQGGSLEAQGKVLAINPLEPSDNTVNAHTDWLKSLSENPAPTQMYFKPISGLAGSKKAAMDEAAHFYISSIQFASDLQFVKNTGSGGGTWNGGTAVYVNGVYERATSLENPGYQVLVLDRNQPSKVIDNRFFSFQRDNWENTYEQMYHDMYQFLEPIGNDCIVVFNSFQMLGGAFPTPDMQNYFTNVIGTGKALQQWADNSTVQQTGNGETVVVFDGTGIPNNGLGSGAGYFLGLFTPFYTVTTYRILNGATLVLGSNGKTEIMSAAQPENA